MTDLADFELLIQSQTPIIVVCSDDEPRVLSAIERLAGRIWVPAYQWAVSRGCQRMDHESPPLRSLQDPTAILAHIRSITRPSIWALADFHPYIEDPRNIRLLKEIAQNYNTVAHTIVLISHELEIPAELSHFCARVEMAHPGAEEIREVVRDVAREWIATSGHQKVKADKGAVDMLVRNLLGLPLADARRLARNAIFLDGAISRSDIEKVMEEKYRLLGQGGILSYEYDTNHFGDIAGFRRLKEWLTYRRDAFLGTNDNENLDRPKGMLLLGVQGCGKSLAAKAVAGSWAVPLLRLDAGALYNKYYGESEANLRKSLKTAEVMSPCVLWIDEIEKGMSTGDGDDGVSQRILATLLTWMAENQYPVFIVATSNNIAKLPPELVRKGRLDEIFFVDLPDAEVRTEILRVHLSRRGLDPEQFDLDGLSAASEGFSGAEIEQAVVSAFYSAHYEMAELTDAHLLGALSETRPLSVVMAEKITALRQWAANRTVPCN